MLIKSLLVASCLALQGLAKPLDVALAPRYSSGGHTRLRGSRGLQRRDADVPFDLNFQVKDQTLFSGQWKPLDGQSVSLSLKCIDCRTWGTLDASATFPDNFEELVEDLRDLNPLNDIDLAVQFSGVGAFVDVGVTAALDGTVLGSQIGILFSVDLVLGLTGEVATDTGFQVAIPDASSFTLPLDPSKDSIAKFDGASASLLPLNANVPANLTIALQLGVQAGVKLTAGPSIDATALAGTFINIPEITIGEGFALNETCFPAFAEIDINAGAFVDIGADLGIIDLPDNHDNADAIFDRLCSLGHQLPGEPDTASCCPGAADYHNVKLSSGYWSKYYIRTDFSISH
ncbi:hypothetical protein SCUP234_02101 [Seiridium cupressi]